MLNRQKLALFAVNRRFQSNFKISEVSLFIIYSSQGKDQAEIETASVEQTTRKHFT